MDVEEALAIALEGDAVLFAGAGFSFGATNAKGEPAPSAGKLSLELVKACNESGEFPLADAADLYLETHGAEALHDLLLDRFKMTAVSDFHREILRVPWRRIYTTNYDNVVELAASQVQEPMHAVTIDQRLSDLSTGRRACVHLNGFIERATPTSLLEDLRLSDRSYALTRLEDTGWASTFRHDVRMARCMFFVGYSLPDLDVKRALIQAPSPSERLFFFLGPTPGRPTEIRAEAYGQIFKESAEQFADRVASVRSAYGPTRDDGPRFLYLSEFDHHVDPVDISDSDLLDLLLFGQLDRQKLATSIGGGPTYFMPRSVSPDALQHVADPATLTVLVGELGNGKSMLVEELALGLQSQGLRVFSAPPRELEVEREIEQLRALSERSVLVLEDYPSWLPVIRAWARSESTTSLVVTARTAAHDHQQDKLYDLVDGVSLREYSVDELTQDELRWLVSTFDDHGLWADRAGHSWAKKHHYLSVDCDRQLHGVLLRLFDSPNIRARLDTLIATLKKEGALYDALFGALILQLLGEPVTLDLLADIWGPDVFQRKRGDSALTLFFEHRSQSLRLRSSVLAEYFITQLAAPGRIVDTMLKMLRELSKRRFARPRYDHVTKGLMKFSTLQQVLPDQKRREATITYFEAARKIDRCKGHPLFWLQYGIAMLFHDDLPRSERYFKTAYSLAADQGFDTFQIDNHYARLLLRQAAGKSSWPEARDLFDGARRIVNRQIRNERLHHAYRTAVLYQDVWDAFESGPDRDAAHSAIRGASRTVEQGMKSLPGRLSRNRHVRECAKAIAYIAERSESSGD